MSTSKHRPGKRDLPEEPTEILQHVLREAKALSDEDDAPAEVDAELVEQLTSTAERGVDETLETMMPGPAVAPPKVSAEQVEWAAHQVERLSWEATATTSARRAAVLLYDLGRISEEYLGDHDGALEAYRQSHERYPALTINCRALVRGLRLRGEHAACVPVLEAELNAASDTGERVAILAERALLRIHRLADYEAALEDLRRAQKMDPEDPVVSEALAGLYRQLGRWTELEELLRLRSRSCGEPELTSALLCEVAHIRERQFQDTEGAATLFRTALNTAPSNLHALQALLRTGRANRDHPAVAKLCEALAEVETGAAAAASLWAAARIYRDRLRNSDLAIAALERACAAAPEDRALFVELADLYERSKKWDKLAETVEQAANLTGTAEESADLLHKLGQVRLERLGDPDGAIAALRQAITICADHIPGRMMLGRLYARQDRFDELAGLLSDELEYYSDPARRAAICFRIGSLYETKLNDPDGAIEAYEAALGHQQAFRPALRGISRVQGALGRHEDLIASYERELAINPAREDRIMLLRRISYTWERKLGDPAAALSSYERLVALDPSNLPALRALHRLYALGSRWQDLVAVLKTDADQAMDRWRRVTLLTEAAEVQTRQLNDDQAAIQTYLEVLELAPSHQPALMAAGRILHGQGRFDELLLLHAKELEHTEDRAHRIWLQMKLGRLLWERLGRHEEAAVAYTDAMNLITTMSDGADGPAHTPRAAADQLIRIFQETKNHTALLQILQKLPLPESAKAQSLHHRRIAEILQHGQRPALAVEHLRRSLEASNDDAVLHQLAQIYAAIGDRQSLIGLFQAEASSLDDSIGLLAVYHKLAALYGEAEYDLERAVEALEQILEIDPRNRVALHLLEVQLARLERWEKLASVLELSREPSDDLDYKVACALEIAALKEDRLDDLQGAAHASFEVLDRYPTHPEALSALEHHYRRSRNIEGLVQVLGRRLKMAQSTTEQAAILTSIAAAHGLRGELEEAVKVGRMATEALPSYLPACRIWLRAARASKDQAGTALALEAEASASHDPERRSGCYLEAGQIWRAEADNPEAAIAAFNQVISIDPTHRGAKDSLVSMHTERKEWRELVELLQRWVEHLTDRDQVINTLARIADLQRSRLGETSAARKTIFSALEIDANDQNLLTTLAELCRAENDWKALARVDLRLLELTSDPVLLKGLHFELGMIYEEKISDVGTAIKEYRRVLELDPNDLGALTRLSALLYQEKDWKEAAIVTEQLLQRDDDRNRVKSYHLRLARIFADGFKEIPRAVASCRRALSLDPGDLTATELMAELLTAAGDRRALDAHLASTLAVHRARLDRDPFRMDSYRALVRVFRRQRAIDPLYVVRSLLTVVGAASPKDQAFVTKLRDGLPPAPERPMTSEEIEELLVHQDERGPLFRLMTGAEAPLRKVISFIERSEGKPEKITARSHPDLAGMLNRLKKAVGGVTFNAYLVDGGAERTVVEDTPTPSLYVGRELGDEFDHAEQSFLLARLVAHVRLRHMLFARFEPLDFGRVIAAVVSVTCRSYTPPYPPDDLEELQVKLTKAMGKRVRRQLESPSLELSDRTIDPSRWRVAMEQSEDRVALAICGDLQAALHCLLRDEAYNLTARLETPEHYSQVSGPRMRQLLAFAISEEYLTLRERLGIAAVAAS
jgi:tetratricopeptide (TPR) repeat protein